MICRYPHRFGAFYGLGIMLEIDDFFSVQHEMGEHLVEIIWVSLTWIII